MALFHGSCWRRRGYDQTGLPKVGDRKIKLLRPLGADDKHSMMQEKLDKLNRQIQDSALDGL